MTTAEGERILQHLRVVGDERTRRQASTALAASVERLKRYQQQRFSVTYDDLLSSPRYSAAARFFLEELYGPGDFSRRDAQFARVVPALVRLFPSEVTKTVETLAELHALSEILDSEMAERLGTATIDAAAYTDAWQATGRANDRERQIGLSLAVGESLDRLTRKPLLGTTLRMMRRPAARVGLGELQACLERGFDTFRAMHGAEEFLAIIGMRERALATLLFGVDPSSLLCERLATPATPSCDRQ